LGGIRTRTAGTLIQTSDIQSRLRTRSRGHGHSRSAARHRRRSRHAGNRQTDGQTAPGCIRRGPLPLGCHCPGGSRRGRRRHHGCSRRRSRGPRWDAYRLRPGHATRRRRIRRWNRHASLRSRLGRRTRHATRRRRHRDSGNYRPARRVARSHPNCQSLLGVRNRQSHGPRYRWGVRAHHRRCRAPARCRLQPLKPPPERIISSAYPSQRPGPNPLRGP